MRLPEAHERVPVAPALALELILGEFGVYTGCGDARWRYAPKLLARNVLRHSDG